MKNKLLVLLIIILLLPKMEADIVYDDKIKVKTEVYKDGTLDSSLTKIYKGMLIDIDGLYKLKIVDYDLDNGTIYLELYKDYKKMILYQWNCENNIYTISNVLVCCPECSNQTVLVYEDEYCDISIRFLCFDRDGMTQEKEDSCCPTESTTTADTYAKLQIYFHKKFTKIMEKNLIEIEEVGLLDNNEKGYQVSEDEIIVSDPYYMTLKDNKILVYETDYGTKLSLNIPTPQYRMNETSYGGYKIGIIDNAIFSMLDPSDALYNTVFNSEMNEGSYIESSLHKIETMGGIVNVCKLIVGEDIYTLYDDGKDNIIFKDDFGIVITKFDPDDREVYLKFLKKVDEEEIDNSSLDIEDYQIVFNEKYSDFLIDVVSGSKILKNRVGLRYEDIKGVYYEEMPFEKDSKETTVTYMNVSVKGENPNAHDFTGLGWADTEIPNFRYASEDDPSYPRYYGTCVRGDEITYTIDYSYSPLAAGDATNVTITDVLDSDLQFLSATGSFVYDGVDTVTWTLGTLHPGDSGTVTVKARVDSATVYGTEIPNEVTLSYTEDMPKSLTTLPVIFKTQAMDIVKEVSAVAASPGDTLTYTLTYYNTTSLARTYGDPPTPSTITVGNIQIEDTIPVNTTVDPATISDGGMLNDTNFNGIGDPGEIIAWNLATLNPESSHSLTFQAVIDSIISTMTISDYATIIQYDVSGSDPFDPVNIAPTTDAHGINSNTVYTTVSVPSGIAHSHLPCCKMSVSKEAPSTGIPGNIITYTIKYQNTGLCENGNAYNVKIIDTLPENTTFINASVAPLVDGNLLIWEIPQVDPGESGEITVDVMINPAMPENAYYVRFYEYKKYAMVKEDWIGLGGIISYDDYSLILDETHKYWYDINEVQIHKGSQKKDDVNMGLYQRCLYDNIVFEFLDNSGMGEKFKGFFRIYKRVIPNINVSSEFKRWDKEKKVWDSEIYSNDKFYLFVYLKNVENGLNIGKGMARDISYYFESDLNCKDVTWMYLNYCEQNLFDIYPNETGYIILEMDAPPVDFEKKYSVDVHISWKDDLGNSFETEKTFNVNVKPSPTSKVLRVEKHVVGSNEMKVGETKKIQVFIRNWSEKEIYVEFEDNIPQGLSVVDGTPEFKGKIKPAETKEIDYVLKGDQEGSYSFSGEAYYEDIYGRHKVISNLIDIHVIGTEKLTLTKEISKNYLSEDEIINISLMLRNNTEEDIKDIEVVDIIPEDFTLVEIFDKNTEWDDENKILRYKIDKLEPAKAKIIKYAVKAPSKAGKYSFLGVRATYIINGSKKEKTTSDFEVIIPEAVPPSLNVDMKILERIPSEDKEIITFQLTLSCGISSIKNIHLKLDYPGFRVLDSEGRIEEGLIYDVDELNPGDEYITKATFETDVGDKELFFVLNGSYEDNIGLDYSLNKELKVSFITKKPIIKITRSLEENAIRFGYSTQIIYTIENTGESKADIKLRDEIPDYIGNDYIWEGKLDPGEKHSLRYKITPKKAGTFELSEASLIYKDRFGNEYTAYSEKAIIEVRGLVFEKTLEENTITLNVTNTYSEKAFDIEIEDYLPEGYETDRALSFRINQLSSNESKEFSYVITKFGDSLELPRAKIVWKDIYQDSYEVESNSVVISYEEEEEKEEKEEEKETPTPPTTSPKPTHEKPSKEINLKYVFIPIISIIVALILYYLFSGRKEEVYGIPVSEGDVWAPIEEKEIEREIKGKRKVWNYKKKEREIKNILNEIEKPSKEDLEIHKLWNMDLEPKRERNVKIPTPIVTVQKPERTEEMKFWKDYMENNKLKALKNDLKNLEIKEKGYKEKGDKNMAKEISELKKIVKNEIKEREGSYENVS